MKDYEYGQLDIFSFIEEIFNMVNEKESKCNIDSSKESRKWKDVCDQSELERSLSKYLKKGEKIISLLKEKSNNNRRVFKKNNLIESINYKVYSQKESLTDRWMYLFQSIKLRFIAPTLEECIQDNEVPNFDSFISLFDTFQDRIQVKVLSDTDYETRLMKVLFKKKLSVCKGSMELCIKGSGTNNKDQLIYCPMPYDAKLTKGQSGRSWSYGSSLKYRVCANAYDYLGRFIILCQFRRIVQDTINSLTKEELYNNVIYYFLVRAQEVNIKSKLYQGNLYIEDSAIDKEYIQTYLRNYSYSIKIVKNEDKKRLEKNVCRYVLSVRDFNCAFILEKNLKSSDWDFISTDIKYTNSIERDIGTNVDVALLTSLFEIIADEYLKDAREEKYRKDLESDYAKSYMTKKNIPQSHIEAMSNSKFNDYFGYIEFDEDTDLLKVEELTKEFISLAKYLRFSKEDEVSLRFRKLGNHKAAGLYYPYLKCLCVDIRYPHSMVHEYFHMLDYTRGKLSRSVKFQKVLNLYKKSLEDVVESLPADHEYRLQLNGKTKYNRSYYFQPTEVFARCGEMFLVRHLGINNSLVEIQNDFVYPINDELKQAYTQYFKEVLQIGNIKEIVAV